MKSKNIILVVLAVVILAIGGWWFWQSSQPENSPSEPTEISNSVVAADIIFFYGNTCPHCKDAEAWMDRNKVEDKITIVKKEVYNNKENAKELAQKAAACGFNPNSGVGVPFLYVEGQCYMGMPDVIQGLEAKLLANDNLPTGDGDGIVQENVVQVATEAAIEAGVETEIEINSNQQ